MIREEIEVGISSAEDSDRRACKVTCMEEPTAGEVDWPGHPGLLC